MKKETAPKDGRQQQVQQVYQNNEHRAELCSGFGQYHTNEADPDNPEKELKPYNTVTIDQIKAMANNPGSVSKGNAQWFIPSTLPSRTGVTQAAEGQYWALWADLDKDPQPLLEVERELYNLDCEFILYATSSAKQDKQKGRIIIELGKPLNGEDWQLAQMCLNDWLDSRGFIPDQANKGRAQLCYLPNKGDFYYSAIEENFSDLFDPMTFFADEIEQIKQKWREEEEASQRRIEEADQKREARLAAGFESPIDAFNATYPVEDILIQAGYKQRGSTFQHPRSESGSYAVSVKDGRVHSLSSSDKLYTGGGGEGAHDAFSAFKILFCGGDHDEALKVAGDQWLMIGDESWNKAKQRKHQEGKSSDSIVSMFNELPEENKCNIDISGIDITKPPGICGDIVQNMAETAHRPLPEAYTLYALQLLSSLANREGYQGSKLNLLTLIIAPSAAGKEHPQRFVKNALYQLKKSDGVVDKPRSDKDMIINLVETIRYERNLFYVIDEVHGMFTAISDKNAQAYMSGIGDEILKMMVTDIYTLSGNHKRDFIEKYQKELANKSKKLEKIQEELAAQDESNLDYDLLSPKQWLEKDVELIEKTILAIDMGIESPALNLAGASTPQNLDKIITVENIDTGLLGRSMIFRANDTREQRNPDKKPFKLNKDLLIQLGDLSTKTTAIRATGEAQQLLEEISLKFERDEYLNHPILGALYARLPQRVVEVASVLSLADSVITPEYVMFALACAQRHIDDCAYILKRNNAGTSHTALISAIKEVVLRIVTPIGEAQSRVRQRVLRAVKEAAQDHEDAKTENRASYYDQAITQLIQEKKLIQEGKRFKRL